MARSEPLWPDVNPVNSAPLSQMYSVPAYRSSAEERARYAESKSQLPCEECVAVQHETRGEFGPRMQTKVRRTFKGGPNLRLRRRHANAWRERDEADVKKKGGAA
jgi:hypothetical protein